MKNSDINYFSSTEELFKQYRGRSKKAAGELFKPLGAGNH